jgi:hypothetical protein
MHGVFIAQKSGVAEFGKLKYKSGRKKMPMTGTLPPEQAILTESEIKALLDVKKVPWRQWKNGISRTFKDLCEYHHKDQLYFRNGALDQFIIDVNVAVVIVLYEGREGWLELHEAYQQFPDGSKLARNFNGIAETMKRSEQSEWRKSAIRCLAEELQFHDSSAYSLSDWRKIEHREPVASEKWNGVMAAYHRHIFECVISRKLFNPHGYVEKNGNRLIYFKWNPLNQLQLKL